MKGGIYMIKIDKRTARKNYEAGNIVYVLPNKVRVENDWLIPMPIERYHDDPLINDLPFDKWLTEYSYYNCNSELGNQLSYYLDE